MGISVLCADDSKHVLDMLARLISSMPEVDKVYKAVNGEEAVRFTNQYKPDVVTLDLKMPVLDGLQALKKIRLFGSIPVIMISSYTQPGAFSTMEALEEGAFGFIPKPASGRPDDMIKMRDELTAMIRQAVEAYGAREFDDGSEEIEEPLVFKPDDKGFGRSGIECDGDTFFTESQERMFEAVFIGCSAGGPRALNAILPKIPGWFPWPIVIVQHMPEFFTKYFSQTLDRKCHLSVKEAEHGEIAKAGHIYIAPGGAHLRVRKIGRDVKLVLDGEFPEVSGAKPSVDVMMESAASSLGVKAIGMILSGMGVDGAAGLLKMKEAGSLTVVQDRSSSLIYGMAGMALKMGAANHIVNVDDIPVFLIYSPIVKMTHIGRVDNSPLNLRT